MSVISRSDSKHQEPVQSIVPRLAHAVTFVPDPADAGPAIGVPVANGHNVVTDCPYCDGPDGVA